MKMTKKIIAGLAVFSLLVMPLVVFAQATTVGGTELFPDEFKPDLGTQELPTTLASIINTILGLLGIVATVLILWAGFLWMTAAGNDEKIGTAKKILQAGIIGLVIIFSAYAIAQFALGKILSATNG